MTLEKIVAWLDRTLNLAAFDDVSNNGLQVSRGAPCVDALNGDATFLSRERDSITTVAVAVDASLKSVRAAAAAGAQLLIVHHGLSWGGGIKRLTGGVYNVVKAAMDANLAIYACHLPLDAHPTLGNNAQLAKILGLKRVKPAFSYHGNVIGFVGVAEGLDKLEKLAGPDHLEDIRRLALKTPCRIGVCSGGAAEFAEEAKRLGCAVLVTGEANWADVIAAENCGAKLLCLGHYETEVYGVRAVAAEMKTALKIKIVDLTK